jgi:hypothetical protein
MLNKESRKHTNFVGDVVRMNTRKHTRIIQLRASPRVSKTHSQSRFLGKIKKTALNQLSMFVHIRKTIQPRGDIRACIDPPIWRWKDVERTRSS